MEKDIKHYKLGNTIQEFEDLLGNTPFDDIEKIKKYLFQNYIPKSKIKEKIEELETKRIKFENDNANRIFIREFTRKYTGKNDHDFGIFNTPEVITYMTNNEYIARISVLNELMEDK